jgi:hypothetical protein
MSPSWFYGYDIAFEVVFAIISLIIAVFAFRIFKASEQQFAKYLGVAFLFISASYFLQSLFNFLAISKINQNICGMIKFSSVAFDAIGLYLHMMFFLLGIILVLYMALKFKGKLSLFLLIGVTLASMIFSSNPSLTYYLLSSIYLSIITWHHVTNFLKYRQTKTLLVALAFLFLFFGSFHYFFSINHQLFYVIGHFLELIAYILILANFYLVLKK